MIKPRKIPPTKPTSRDNHQSFRIWFYAPVTMEDPRPYKCVAAFSYLLECLDWMDVINARGVDVYFQSPCKVELKTAAEFEARTKTKQEVNV